MMRRALLLLSLLPAIGAGACGAPTAALSTRHDEAPTLGDDSPHGDPATRTDATPAAKEGSPPPAPPAPGPPALMTVGRFDDSDPGGKLFAWPGTRVVARFDGTAVSVTLSHTNGFSPVWIISWRFLLVASENLLLHWANEHLNGFSPV